MLRRPLLVLALLAMAAPAHALSAILHFDGTVSAVYGSTPSLTALGLSPGTPLHYEVKVNTQANAYYRGDGWLGWQPDYWNAPDDHADYFYAELVAQAYPTPGSYYNWGREDFVGVDFTHPNFSCAPLARFFVGVAMFQIAGCGALESWEVGKEVASWHLWHDPDTGEESSVFGDLTLTQIVPVPEPRAAAMLASGAALLACLHRRRLRA